MNEQPKFVTVNGEPWSAARCAERSISAPLEVRRDQPVEYHRGWRVVGHAPGAMEKAEARAAADMRSWERLSEDERARALRSGGKAPQPWCAERWRREARKSNATKPLFCPSAAEAGAELARKSGWLDVDVEEVKKELSGMAAARRAALG